MRIWSARNPKYVREYVHDPVTDAVLQAAVSGPTTAPATGEEIAMRENSGKKVFVAFAAVAALTLGVVSATAANDRDDRGHERGGFVVPCSLDGVNPAFHPEVFGNAATALSFGFVQGPDRVWRVRPDCRR
jgi:hypothetical protein